jgi:hypothetical protein
VLASAEARLADFTGLDDAIAAHRVQEIRAFAEDDRRRPEPRLDVPPALIARKVERDEAVDRVQAARAAVTALVEEHETVKRALAEIEARIRAAAVEVLKIEAEAITSELRQARRLAARLTKKLASLGSFGSWRTGVNNHSHCPRRRSPSCNVTT